MIIDLIIRYGTIQVGLLSSSLNVTRRIRLVLSVGILLVLSVGILFSCSLEKSKGSINKTELGDSHSVEFIRFHENDSRRHLLPGHYRSFDRLPLTTSMPAPTTISLVSLCPYGLLVLLPFLA